MRKSHNCQGQRAKLQRISKLQVLLLRKVLDHLAFIQQKPCLTSPKRIKVTIYMEDLLLV
jgi:hypothetical protein